MSRNRNSSKNIYGKMWKQRQKISTCLNEYEDDQGKGTKTTKSWKFPIYPGQFDLGGRYMCHSVTTTGNNYSSRIHYVVKSYFQGNQISISLIFCFKLDIYKNCMFLDKQGVIPELFFHNLYKRMCIIRSQKPFPITSDSWV